jgi:hypothetical protein
VGDTNLKVSVVIRTRDKEKHFHTLMENLTQQTVQASEIILVDNYSSNERLQTLENDLAKIAKETFANRKIKLKLAMLSDNEFSHAYSTNLGMCIAENELVCMTNAHSLPVSLHWLQDGIRHFEDEQVAGVTGFFMPHRKTAVTGRVNEITYYLSQKMVVRQDWCSTINGIVRKSAWKTYPFDENLPKIIPETKRYGLEDYDWSKEMTARGYKIVVDPSFSVFHSHGGTVGEMRRNVKGYFIYRSIQQKINSFTRPRVSFSRVFQPEYSPPVKEISV